MEVGHAQRRPERGRAGEGARRPELSLRRFAAPRKGRTGGESGTQRPGDAPGGEERTGEGASWAAEWSGSRTCCPSLRRGDAGERWEGGEREGRPGDRGAHLGVTRAERRERSWGGGSRPTICQRTRWQVAASGGACVRRCQDR